MERHSDGGLLNKWRGEVIQIKHDRLNQTPNKVTAQPQKQSAWQETVTGLTQDS